MTEESSIANNSTFTVFRFLYFYFTVKTAINFASRLYEWNFFTVLMYDDKMVYWFYGICFLVFAFAIFTVFKTGEAEYGRIVPLKWSVAYMLIFSGADIFMPLTSGSIYLKYARFAFMFVFMVYLSRSVFIRGYFQQSKRKPDFLDLTAGLILLMFISLIVNILV